MSASANDTKCKKLTIFLFDLNHSNTSSFNTPPYWGFDSGKPILFCKMATIQTLFYLYWPQAFDTRRLEFNQVKQRNKQVTKKTYSMYASAQSWLKVVLSSQLVFGSHKTHVDHKPKSSNVSNWSDRSDCYQNRWLVCPIGRPDLRVCPNVGQHAKHGFGSCHSPDIAPAGWSNRWSTRRSGNRRSTRPWGNGGVVKFDINAPRFVVLCLNTYVSSRQVIQDNLRHIYVWI